MFFTCQKNPEILRPKLKSTIKKIPSTLDSISSTLDILPPTLDKNLHSKTSYFLKLTHQSHGGPMVS